MLGNGAPPLYHLARPDVGHQSPNDRFDIESGVAEEVLVLRGDQGFDKGGRDVRIVYELAVYSFKEDAENAFTIIIIDRAFRKDDVLDDAPFYSPGCLFGDFHIDEDKGGHCGKKEKRDRKGKYMDGSSFHKIMIRAYQFRPIDVLDQG